MLVSNRLSLILLIFCGVFGAETDEIKTISVKTGDSVVLHTGVREINREKQILWLFGAEDPDTLIAEIYKLSISIYDTYEGLKDRLQMDQQTGSHRQKHHNQSLWTLYGTDYELSDHI